MIHFKQVCYGFILNFKDVSKSWLIPFVTLQDDNLVYKFSNFFDHRLLFKKYSVGQVILCPSAFLLIPH